MGGNKPTSATINRKITIKKSGAVKKELQIYTLIEKDHLGDRSPEKDCC